MHKHFIGVMIVFVLAGCKQQTENRSDTLFTKIPGRFSNITFNNTLEEDEHFNIIEYLYFYNGGGVSIGDINNDGLADIYFTKNQGHNALYLNEGNFKFKDITQAAGVQGAGNWTTGVTMADVNADGLLDIYVCGVGNYKNFTGFNQLFINNGDLTFTERSAEYGLHFQGFSTQAAFFDYDLDGDLDLYLLNHSVHSTRSYGKAELRHQVDSLAGDRLYQNQLAQTGVTSFINVTTSAGILSSQVGYGLGVGISDLNRDGYPDIYVSNDFHENDYLYINQKDGTFSETSATSLAHTSRFSMGNVIADLNNDLWPDVIATDMLPQDEAVIKTSAGEDSYEVYRYKLQFGYGKQVSRNTLQLNRGLIDSAGLIFSDIAQAAGIEATDWSWGPLAADFDGDERKDIFISNGIVKRPNDLDYISYLNSDSAQRKDGMDAATLVKQMPEGRVSNYIFKNEGDLVFRNKAFDWGLDEPGFSNGAAYGDLDNDGDLDLVINQINGEALVYKNNLDPEKYVKVKLEGFPKGNTWAIGSKVTVRSASTQTQELFPTRGWCSSSDYALTFAVPSAKHDSIPIAITWPDGAQQDTVVHSGIVTISYRPNTKPQVSPPGNGILKLYSLTHIAHEEDDFNAFNREQLIPHMLTTEGPAFAVGDINGDNLDDFFIGGAKGQAGRLFIQKADGSFYNLLINDFEKHKFSEDVDAAFFDADGDRDLDLIVVSGGHEAKDERDRLVPRLYLNNGGVFKYAANAFEDIFVNASCVKVCDYDLDGDNDLFIGASVMPFLYGMSPVSFLLRNNGKGTFENVKNWLGNSEFNNPTRVRPGMVKDAVWTNLNGDQLPDLILVGEWMPITVLMQQPDHSFKNQTTEYGLNNTNGMWNTIEADDLNGDGKPDFVVGNLGLNSRIRASITKPLQMYLGDFDSNGGSDHILVYYNGDSSYPFPSRDQLLKQIPSLKKKFPTYKAYRDVRLEDIITPVQKGNSALMEIDELKSVLLLSGAESFRVVELPRDAQYFPIYAISIADIDQDKNKDILLTGNFSATQPDFGSYDAGVGLVLKGDGLGNFKALSPSESGFVTLGEGRSIKFLRTKTSEKLILVARNNSTVLAFK